MLTSENFNNDQLGKGTLKITGTIVSINCNSPVQALSINAPAPSLGLVIHAPTNFSLVPGIPAEPKLVDILRAKT